jgi:RHS repeat-associated protein
VDGVTEAWVYDPWALDTTSNDAVLDFQNGTLTRRWLHGPATDEPLAFESYASAATPGTGTARDLHADRLGSILRVVDPATGQVAAEYTYDSFGNQTQTGSLTQRYGFTGREVDDESGLIYFRARHYDPTLGQFIQRDPIGFAGGDLNLYAYVWNDPLNYSDPSGLSAVRTVGRGALVAEWTIIAGNALQQGGAAVAVVTRYCLSCPLCKGAVNQGIQQGIGELGETLGLGSPDGTKATPPTASGGPIGDIFSGIFAMVDKITEKLADIARSVPNEGATGGGGGPGPDDGGDDGDGTPKDNKKQNKQFNDAVKEIERTIGERLTKADRRELHDWITGQNFDYRQIVEEGLSLFQ